MAIPIQYDLLDDYDEISILKKEMLVIHEKSENVRRGMFVRHKKLEEGQGELLKMILKQQDEIAMLRRLLIEVKNA